MSKSKQSIDPQAAGAETRALAPRAAGVAARPDRPRAPGPLPRISAQSIASGDQFVAPNRALALLERAGDSWRFVRAHLWFESPRAPVPVPIAVRKR